MTTQLPTYVKEKINDAILPVEYTAAVNAIAKCMTIDESKYWSDKADALAAWAKIYKNDQAATEAKRLKLHAFRRMSELADQLRPHKHNKAPRSKGGTVPGPRSLLIESGFSPQQALDVRRIGALREDVFSEMIASPEPPGIKRAAREAIGHGAHPASCGRNIVSDAWRFFAGSTHMVKGNGMAFRTFARANGARDLASRLKPGESVAARKIVVELQEWLDEFEQYLPKG